jgi:hypothetical protein
MPTQHGPILIAGHELAFDAEGCLRPWTSWVDALAREMEFYQLCPRDHGYPRFVHATFLDGDWNPMAGRTDSIPSTQNGMGIISYLKYHEFVGGCDPRYRETARRMGDYLVTEALTPDAGRYPRVTRSTGQCAAFPLPADAGSQGDRPYETEPDKAGIAGHALLLLFAETGDGRYLAQALQNARVLAANQHDGDETHSPWPFRVDYRSGAARGAVSGNMSFVLRLYDGLLTLGHREFFAARESLWTWIRDVQIPSAAAGGGLFAQFFEDHETATNRTAWAPLNLARYLLERKDALSPGWRGEAATLIEFVRSTFTHREFGIAVCHEQDEDHEAWGGINATYGAVLASYAKAIASESLAREARQALDFTLYSIDEQGRPRDLHTSGAVGGWQEDAHTDVIHNFVDAMAAFPEWRTACGAGA